MTLKTLRARPSLGADLICRCSLPPQHALDQERPTATRDGDASGTDKGRGQDGDGRVTARIVQRDVHVTFAQGLPASVLPAPIPRATSTGSDAMSIAGCRGADSPSVRRAFGECARFRDMGMPRHAATAKPSRFETGTHRKPSGFSRAHAALGKGVALHRFTRMQPASR